MANEHILLILPNSQTGQLIERAALLPSGYEVTLVTRVAEIDASLQKKAVDLIIVGDQIEGRSGIELMQNLILQQPFLPMILLPEIHSESLALEAFRKGFVDYLPPPIRSAEIEAAVSRGLEKRHRWLSQVQLETRKGTTSLQSRLDGLETIEQIGRQVTSLLDLDKVLEAVVDAAVALTHAEEGSLLLLDETTGELYMRAGRNFKEDFVRTFRLPIHDTLAGQVLRTGKPILMDEKTPHKIKTAYLVYTIMYVPLIVHDRVLGVLEVDNRQSRNPFQDYHITLVSALADYAAIAIDNARLYSHSEVERTKLESILTKIEESVIIVDHDRRVVLVNRKAREAFGIQEQNISGKRIREFVQHQELLEMLAENLSAPSRAELTLEDGRVLNAQFTPIPEIGMAVTMQDITHLKELDRIKSDFVNTVSHDLRSPLTAILGYVELLERVGPVNEQQREFIRRVHISVNNITSLINDLLDLGRIEAGFDARKEIMPFSAIIHYAVDGIKGRADEKKQTMILDVPDDLPEVLGNPVRLKQMISNLIANAIKYTAQGGKVKIIAHAEGEQIILQVIDTGPGIPPTDLPYIFDKFYRASNIQADTPGTGLGLAIVKSIVENHLGRIWVESALGKGTAFTIVLPIAERNF